MFNAPAYALTQIRLTVVSTVPKGIVHIDENTEVELRAEFEEPRDGRAATSITTTSAAWATRSGSCARWSNCRCAIPSCSPASASIRPRACCCTARRAPARPGSRRRSPTKATPNSSPSTGPKSWARPMARARSACARCSRRPQRAAPSIMFIDEIDSIAPKRSQVHGEAEKRLVAQLLTLMDGLRRALQPGRHRRHQPARCDRRGAAPAGPLRPRDRDRRARRKGPPRDPGDPHPRHAAGRRRRPRGAGAHHPRLRRRRYRRARPRGGDRGGAPDHAQARPRSADDPARSARNPVRRARRFHRGAEARPAVRDARSDGAGAERRLGRYRRARTRRRKSCGKASSCRSRTREAFHRLGIRPAKGFLLYGPPGTGKTLLAKAVAKEAEANFISIKSSDLLSKWYGESEQQIARLFARARQVAPCVVFIDEIDSLVPARGVGGGGEPQVTARVVNTILAEMDGMEELQSIVRDRRDQPARRWSIRRCCGPAGSTSWSMSARRTSRAASTSSRSTPRDMPLAEDVDLAEIAERDRPLHRRRPGRRGAPRRPDRDPPGGRGGREEVTAADFAEALEDSRATVTAEMEAGIRQDEGRAEEAGRGSPADRLHLRRHARNRRATEKHEVRVIVGACPAEAAP